MIDCETETPGGYRQVVRVNAHTLHADVGPAEGSTDSAPGPHDYFDTALATCKALTATWYAKRNGIALDRVEAHVERDASEERKGTYVLKVKVAFFGALSDAEKQKLWDVITRCPVHKLMTKVKIDIQQAPL